MTAQAAREPEEPILLREQDGAVARLLLNRPEKYNALSEEMLHALQIALDEIAAEDETKVLVLAARGKAFCAGHDLKQMRAKPDRGYYDELFARCSHMMLTLTSMPQPVIAQVQGIATAAGCQLVATCDLAVAGESARFATSGINVGLFCSTPAVAVSRNMGRKRAFELLMTGDFIDAATAAEQGLINRAVPDAALEEEVMALARQIAAKPSAALRTGKRLFYRQLETGMAEAYRQAADAMACNMMDVDAEEGIDAFIEKRRPSWAGE